MSRKYKFHNPDGLYFVSFATINWTDVFVRRLYADIVVESLNYCVREKGMQVYSWCIMPSHLHLVFRSDNQEPQRLLQDFKRYTAKQIIQAIKDNVQESRREWLIWMMERAGRKIGRAHQFWQHHNKPIELWSSAVIDQKLDYIHANPVEAGFVEEGHFWQYSSAIDYAGGRGLVKLEAL